MPFGVAGACNIKISVGFYKFDKLACISEVLEYEISKILWLETIVKALTIYEDNFLSKLIKEDPNVSYMNSGNQKTKIPTSNTEDNLSNELVKYLEEHGKEKLSLERKADEEYLLLFFDLLYRKYKGGR